MQTSSEIIAEISNSEIPNLSPEFSFYSGFYYREMMNEMTAIEAINPFMKIQYALDTDLITTENLDKILRPLLRMSISKFHE
jgi:hypothetical protein